EPKLVLDQTPSSYEHAVAFRPDGRQLAVGHADKTVSVYDLETRQRIRLLNVGALPQNLAFNPKKGDGRLAVACGNAVRIFDVDKDLEHKRLRHAWQVTWTSGLAWHPDG